MDVKIYIVWALVGFAFLFMELTAPTMFFLNLAIGAFFTGIVAFFCPDCFLTQVGIFSIVSIACVLMLRPFLLKNRPESAKTGIEGKYIGHEAQVIAKIGEPEKMGVGKIKIYGEVWEAKSENEGETFEPFEMVEIVRNESLVMFVRKRGEEK